MFAWDLSTVKVGGWTVSSKKTSSIILLFLWSIKNYLPRYDPNPEEIGCHCII